MKLIPLIDRSTDKLELLITKNFGDDYGYVLGLLKKLPAVCCISLDGQTIGFLNLKQTLKTVHIPIYLNREMYDNEVSELMQAIHVLLQGMEYQYLVFVQRKPIPEILSVLKKFVEVENIGLHYCKESSQTSYEISPDTFTWTANIPDPTALKSLHLQCFADEKEYVVGTWDSLIAQYLASEKQKICFACFQDGLLVGSILGYLGDTNAYIYSVCVLPACSSRGIGSKLMRLFLNQCPSLQVELHVYSENKAATALYEKLGFWKTGIASLVARNIINVK
ncbi:MAG: GNAT family N-acetyltransferase [Candidatus Cloacimonas sp.]|jgi:ribosomal protein S18 acetylase RimI-like enzyme|nr:GNAT family N-acetyltransferase [Candidatus Cloacimonas sp.]